MYVNPDDVSFKGIIGKYPFLQKYTSPMKKMERELVGRSQEMRSLKAAFNRAELSNVLLLAEAGSGKAIDNDEMLPVNDGRGYIRMGDVAVGDQVFDEEGTATPVVGVFPQGKKRAYRVTFFDGTSVVCNDEHIWRVEDVASHFRKSPKYFDYTLAELMHHGLFDESTGASLWYVPVCNALQRGVYLDAVRDDAEHYGAAVGRTLSMDVKAGYPMDESDFKAFLYADLSLRQLFLDSVLKQLPVHVHPYTGTITVGVGDGELAQQLREMWTSVGTRSVVDGELLRLYPSLRSMGISKVEDLGEEREMTCIYVASPLHTFVVGRDHIVTHNTALVQGTMEKDDKRIYLEVDLSRMIADLTNVDEISDKLKRLFSEASEFGKDEKFEVVLFMDEFHQVVQISAVAVEALKPLLADSATRGIHVVAATTYVEFMKHISSNQPLVERLQRINLPEVDRDTTVSILHGMAKRYGVSGKIADEGLYGLIYEYTNRYIPANAQPRKSILVLDSMIGWHRSEGRNMDLKLLADVIYESEGVNVAFRVDPTTIKERIDEKVYAQDYATASIAQRLQLCVADLNDKSKTMSNFLFCGSTGVGKTEVVKQMAGILFGDAQRHLHRLDMSEYANPDSLERFRLELTTMVWERPYCIILLDEIEKACGEIVRLLLSVLDDARLTDRNGRVVSFNNAYVVMTTNAGSEIFKTIAQYEASDTGSGEFLVRYDKLIRKSLMSAVGSNRFPPELLGRVNCIVPFQPLSEATMRRIVENKLFELKRELFRKHRVEMKVSSKVIDYLVLDSLDTDSDSGGARSVISKLESEVTTAVARYVNANPDVHEIGVKVEGEMAFENKQRAISEAYIKVVGVREARSG